jgi:hypothetical protein
MVFKCQKVNKHFDSGAKKGHHRALDGQDHTEGHHEIAQNVKGHPEKILAFAMANSSHSALLLC